MTAELAGEAGTVDGRSIDAMDEAQVRALIADVEAKYGSINLLVNGVGGSTIVEDPRMTIDEMSFDDWQKLIDFNLSATFLFCNTVIPCMKKAGSGKIVSLASIAGRGLSLNSSSAYAAAGGIIALTRKTLHGAWSLRHQRERDRAKFDPDGALDVALGEAQCARPQKSRRCR